MIGCQWLCRDPTLAHFYQTMSWKENLFSLAGFSKANRLTRWNDGLMRRGTWSVRKISVHCQFLASAGGTLWLYRTPTLYLGMFFWLVWETCCLLLQVMTAFRSIHLALSPSLLPIFFHLSYLPSVSPPVTNFKSFFHITSCGHIQATFFFFYFFKLSFFISFSFFNSVSLNANVTTANRSDIVITEQYVLNL